MPTHDRLHLFRAMSPRTHAQCATECASSYDVALTKCNQKVSNLTKGTYGANLDACANVASGIMDDCMVSRNAAVTIAARSGRSKRACLFCTLMAVANRLMPRFRP